MVFVTAANDEPVSCPCTGVSLERIAAAQEAAVIAHLSSTDSWSAVFAPRKNDASAGHAAKDQVLAQSPTKTSPSATRDTADNKTSNTTAAPSSIFSLSSASSSNDVANTSSTDVQSNDSEDGPGMPEDYSRKLAAQLHRRLDTFLKKSTYIAHNANLADLPRLERSDMSLGKTIARGGFSTIIEVNAWNSSKVQNAMEQQQPCHHHDYVVKSLSTGLTLKKIPGAAKDIVLEAHTLSALKHESIIAVRGWCHDGVEAFSNTQRADGFFFILDRLGDTLFQRVYQWQAELRFHPGSKYANRNKKDETNTAGSLLTRKQIARHQMHEKLQIAVDISSALAYMHERRIIHRDIKSANIAFDPRNNNRAKLIDFGLAAELPQLDPILSNKKSKTVSYQAYPLTGNIGTARYMSPEVISEEHYNEKADVHSFAVLCWECCAAKKPYDHLDAKNVKEHVLSWNLRPMPYWSWPLKLQRILKKGWARKPQDRPSMAEFHKALVKVQAKLPASTIVE